MVFDQAGIEGVITEHFKGIFNGSPLSPRDVLENPADDGDNTISYARKPMNEDEFEKEVCAPYTVTELDEILDTLPSGKASSTDHIPNELLKNTTPLSRIYLQFFLNKIMAEGEVPESLNQGKCVLIYKVIYNIKTIKTF